MKIEVHCPKCGKQFQLVREHSGRKAKCVCGEIFTVQSNSCPPQQQNDPENYLFDYRPIIKAVLIASIVVFIVVFMIIKLNFSETKTDTKVSTQIEKSPEIKQKTFLNEEASQATAPVHTITVQEQKQPEVVKEVKPKEQFPVVDLTWTKLPDSFRGHDIESIYKAFKDLEQNIGMTRDQFETKEQFINRIDSSLPCHLIGDLSSDSILAFMPRDCEKKYNAEKQEYQFSIPETLQIKKNRTDSNKYIGQSAMGAVAEISKWREDKYFAKTPENALENLKVSLNLPPQKAKQLNDKLRIMYIVKPSLQDYSSRFLFQKDEYSYTSHYTEHKEPTISRPHDVSTFSYNLFVEMNQVWVIVEDTGEILKKKEKTKTSPLEKLNWHLGHIPRYSGVTSEQLQNLKHEIVGSTQENSLLRVNVYYEKYDEEHRWTHYYRLVLYFQKDKWSLASAKTCHYYGTGPKRFDIEVPGTAGFSLIEGRDLGLDSDSWDLHWKYETIYEKK